MVENGTLADGACARNGKFQKLNSSSLVLQPAAGAGSSQLHKEQHQQRWLCHERQLQGEGMVREQLEMTFLCFLVHVGLSHLPIYAKQNLQHQISIIKNVILPSFPHKSNEVRR